MNTRLLLYALGVWCLFSVLAILNAGVREKVYAPKVGEHAGHVISTITFIAMILIVTYLFLNEISLGYTQTDLVVVGTMWLIMTIGFEFIAGHYVFGNSWKKLLHDYNILEGRVWSFVLIALFIAPYVIGYLLKRS